MRTPVTPPVENVTMNPINHNIGVVKTTFPRYMVKSQLKIFTPVGTAMIMVMIPKKALILALAPIVKKWCNQTINDKKVIDIIAQTIETYPKRYLWEKVATT